jgi:hypothetical protein
MHHLVSLARSAWQHLSQLLLLGPAAPLAQQQLQQLQQEQRRQFKKLKQTQLSSPPVDGADAAYGNANGATTQQQQQDEMTALARAWRSVCGPNLRGFDAWVLLRQEALPCAARADPLANAQLQQQLKAQRWCCEGLLTSAMEAEAADGDDDDDDVKQQQQQQKGKKRKLAAAANGSSSSSIARGALVQLLHAGAGQVEAPKASRAVLRSIPDQVGRHVGRRVCVHSAIARGARSVCSAICIVAVVGCWLAFARCAVVDLSQKKGIGCAAAACWCGSGGGAESFEGCFEEHP